MISVVIIAYNQEKKIKVCLESVKWADEIIFVDLESIDSTAKIAKQYTDKVFFHKNLGYVEPVRNFSIAKAHGDWILLLDADEEIPRSLAEKLQTIVKEDPVYSYIKIPRKNIIFGKWISHSGWWPDYVFRFFKKGTVHWQDTVHSIPKVTGDGFTLEGEEYAISHYNYDSVSEFFHRNFENYARLEAEEKLKNGYVFAYTDVVKFPLSEFLSRYFLREGYKDGLHGLILSVFMAFYHLAVFAYLWERNKFVEISTETLDKGLQDVVKRGKKEFMFWHFAKNITNERSTLKKFVLRIRRKLQS